MTRPEGFRGMGVRVFSPADAEALHMSPVAVRLIQGQLVTAVEVDAFARVGCRAVGQQ